MMKNHSLLLPYLFALGLIVLVGCGTGEPCNAAADNGVPFELLELGDPISLDYIGEGRNVRIKLVEDRSPSVVENGVMKKAGVRRITHLELQPKADSLPTQMLRHQADSRKDRTDINRTVWEEVGVKINSPTHAVEIGESRVNPCGTPECSTARSITHGPFIGHLTSSSVVIWARFSSAGKYRLWVDREGGAGEHTDALASAERDFCVVWQLKSLQAATRYRYRINVGDEALIAGNDFHFTTPPNSQRAIVRLAFASCAKEDASSAAVWRQMRTTDPHAVVLLGDTPYIDSTDLAIQRRRYGEFAAAAGFKGLVRNRALYSTWDDHDFGRNDTDGNLPGKENSRRAFMEYRANPSYGDGKQGIYTKFRRGGVEVFLLDTRYFAGTEPSPFDRDRPSLLGSSQWKWLRRELRASTAPFKVLACGMIWNGAVRPGKQDHWGTYPHELDALFKFIGEAKIPGMILVGGDIHRTRVLRHMTTRQAGYRIPELITSPTHSSVIATAKVPHPALVHDSGEPNTFLLMTIDNKSNHPTLQAKFLNKSGRTLYSTVYSKSDLEAK